MALLQAAIADDLPAMNTIMANCDQNAVLSYMIGFARELLIDHPTNLLAEARGQLLAASSTDRP